MSKEYENQDPVDIANQAEKDLNSQAAKEGLTRKGASDSTMDSGVDESVSDRFPGSSVTTGGSGNNSEIPIEEGGSINKETGQLHKAKDFEGAGGPEDKAEMEKLNNPGSDDIRENIR